MQCRSGENKKAQHPKQEPERPRKLRRRDRNGCGKGKKKKQRENYALQPETEGPGFNLTRFF